MEIVPFVELGMKIQCFLVFWWTMDGRWPWTTHFGRLGSFFPQRNKKALVGLSRKIFSPRRNRKATDGLILWFFSLLKGPKNPKTKKMLHICTSSPCSYAVIDNTTGTHLGLLCSIEVSICVPTGFPPWANFESSSSHKIPTCDLFSTYWAQWQR